MLVVADSSPLIVLVQIEHIDVLPKLFGQVVVPPEVLAELCVSKRPQPIREFFRHRPTWLEERAPTSIEPIPALHSGEVAAISLVKELKADLLLIDDRDGRRAAAERGLPFTGTIGVLEIAAEQDLLALEDTFEKVKRTDFWISRQLLDERLELYRERRRKP
jgi:predicted nucleic acid-binding protein